MSDEDDFTVDVRETPAGLEVVRASTVVKWATYILAHTNDHVEVTAGEVRLYALNGTWTYVICGFEEEGRVVKTILKSVTASELTSAIPLPVKNATCQ